MSRELVETMSASDNLTPATYWGELQATVFKGKQVGEERVFNFLAICNKLGLNPVQKEAYYMEQQGTWSVVISIDGWIKIATRHKDYDGMSFSEQWSDDGKTLISVTCIIKRKSWSQPMAITEYLQYCQRPTKPWKDNPVRMLRHKAAGQAVRYAFGAAAVADLDDWERMAEMEDQTASVERPVEREINPIEASEVNAVLDLIIQSQSLNDLGLIRQALQDKKFNLSESEMMDVIGPAFVERQRVLQSEGVTYDAAN